MFEVKKPLKRPWQIQSDGDLWRIFWETLQARGPYSIRVTKVKGHATEKRVNDGVV